MVLKTTGNEEVKRSLKKGFSIIILLSDEL